MILQAWFYISTLFVSVFIQESMSGGSVGDEGSSAQCVCVCVTK